MLVLFRKFSDGSFVWLKQVSRLSVLSDKYEVVYQAGHDPLVELYSSRRFSLLGICHEDL